ncbi:MAG: DUF6175 family protein [Prevotella sp.]|nr:DUF6175 family protein [Prevotella sp.]MDY4161187.1 DUF6175 family protein [Prevotella sp.]
MKNTLLSITLLFVALCIYAQNSVTVQPKIMVVPYTTEGQDIRQIIETDPNMRVVLSKIREAFDSRGFTTVDFETKLKAQSANNGLSQSSSGNGMDLKAMIIQGSGADIYVEAEYQISNPAVGEAGVKVLLKACDVSTGASLASKDAFSGVFRTSDIGRLAGTAVEKIADDFLSVIQMKFNDIVTNGRSINVNLKISDGSMVTFTKEYDGEELADLINDWMADHAYQNNFHVQGQTELEIIFDDVRIPLKDANGRNYNIQQFDREIRQFFRSHGIKVEHVTKNNTLVITIK